MSHPSRRVRVARRGDIAPGEGKVVTVGGRELALFRVGDDYHAIDNACPHQGGALGEGTLEGTVVYCPWHGWPFDVTSGRMPGHDRICIDTYRVVVDGDDVLVELPEPAR